MNKKKLISVLAAVLLAGALAQAGAVFIFANGTNFEAHEIPQEVLDRIRENEPEQYEKRLKDFNKLLSKRDVHPTFQSEIERLVMAGYPIQDILIAYEYLYDQFGFVSELSAFVAQKHEGATWKTIFAEYKNANEAFVPRAFDPDYLESLLSTSGFKADDVMIADRVSFQSGKEVKELFEIKLEQSLSWKEVNAQLGILYSASAMPRVKITQEMIEKYTSSTSLTEEQVIEAMVLAHKTGWPASTLVDWYEGGLTEEEILANIYIEIYQ